MVDFYNSNLVTLKNKNWFERQQVAGSCVSKTIKSLCDIVKSKPNKLTLKDLEKEAESIILSEKCTPTFKGYKGFPGTICLSVNEQLVHGIPSDYQLTEGDVLKIDLGATYQGAIADSATTVIFGTPKSPIHVELIQACKDALRKGIEAIQVGKKIGAIGFAIDKFAKTTPFGLVTVYGGHGIDENVPHAPPFVPNKSSPSEGVRIQPGMTIAIEPMLVVGQPQTKVLKDGWTVMTPGIGVHTEHTIFVGEDKVYIMTE